MNTKQQEDLLFLMNDAVQLRNSPKGPREITAEMIPQGDDVESRRMMQRLIIEFYQWWKTKHSEMKLRNVNLGEYINIRHISIFETAGHAALTYLSTLAVLQLDAILTYATKVSVVKKNPAKANQEHFTQMILMQYSCPGIGLVKLTVGVKSDKEKTKVQYCITAMEPEVQKEKRTGGKPIR